MILRFISTCFFLTIISFVSVAQTGTSTGTPETAAGSDSSEYKIFEKVDIEASFPGGETAWRKFLEKNLRADVATENGAIPGVYTVYIQFVVDKEGNVSDLKPLTHWGYGMEAEVMRLLKQSPGWTPANQNGRAVRAYRKQPVTFAIEQDGLEVNPGKSTVLYVGADNPVTITVRKVKDEKLRVTISQGTITGSNGNYIVRANAPGRAIIEIYNKNKKVGDYSFEVKSRDKSQVIPNIIKN
jgi:hypothetical protein